MATYPTTLGGLRTRIITETNRDDLADELASALDTAISDSIEFYAAEPWWFNQARTTSNCTPAAEYITRPTGARIIDRPFLVVGNVRYDMTKRSMEEIEGLYATPISGQPTDYCEFGAQVRLWPTPNLAYQIIWLSDADVAALDYSDADSSSYWTTTGASLISARARIIFFRDYFRDDAGLARATLAEREWYRRLKAETNRRVGTGRVRGSW